MAAPAGQPALALAAHLEQCGVRVELPARDSVIARADEPKLRQVLANILVNAAEAAAAGTAPEIRVEVTQADEAVLTVTDRGAGMSPEVLAHVFDPFFTTKREGTGLGLPIAQAIVDAHGGHIDIASESGHGTRVSIRLPAAAALEKAS